ncbi:AmpG family muropeptide MFS transporter [uncultured Salinisphaera sp.]|uniref:AmpG family muropeptide MFS transporter n=1 Tax=uncultured Salinisphaera sp. TaxID=359372 RepID=UPI0032B28C14|tara:strand:+ start:11144 stop:12544 length:1401 start_codon:yes stop_codon:yes gene_type:complete
MTLDSEYRVAGRAGAPATRKKRDWRAALVTYTRPRVVGMGFLGFSSGLPFLLVFSTLSAWLATAGVSKTTIGLFSWLGLTYSFKFVLAPFIDRIRLPGLGAWLGKRRAWMLLAQAGLMAGLLAMAGTDPTTALSSMAWFGLLVAFASSIQDISIDAWRIEAVASDLQGAMAATYLAGYRIAMLVAGAGSFYIAAASSWPTAYVVMAGLVVIGMITVLLLGEPDVETGAEVELREQWAVDWLARRSHQPAWFQTAARWVIGAVVCPFWDFLARYGRVALVILAVVGLYRACEITLAVMSNPFYLDIGYSPEEIASVTKIFGLVMVLTGAALGGVLVARIGVLRAALVGAVLSPASNLMFVWLSWQTEPGVTALAAVISVENLANGMAMTAFIAYLSSLTNVAYTATQYALFSSLMTLPGKFVGGFSGWVVERFGYGWFFFDTALIGLPVIVLLGVLLIIGPRPGDAR